ARWTSSEPSEPASIPRGRRLDGRDGRCELPPFARFRDISDDVAIAGARSARLTNDPHDLQICRRLTILVVANSIQCSAQCRYEGPRDEAESEPFPSLGSRVA